MPKHTSRNRKRRSQPVDFEIGYWEPNNSDQNFDYSEKYSNEIPNSISTSSCAAKDRKVNKNFEEEIEPEICDDLRTIKRADLYKIPDLQAYMYNYRFRCYKLNILKNDMKYWKKEEENRVSADEPVLRKPKKKRAKRINEFEKKINKMLAQPVEMSKGKSILERMGWKGGGLGKNGSGILEPIIPKATYAVKTFGLGHVTEPEQVEIREDDFEFNNYFRTNVLLNILAFIKNNLEVDILFDAALWRCERKRVHNIVQELRKCTFVEELAYDNPIDTAIAGDILKLNMYLLLTKSAGKAPNRKLCVFKDAPPHIYLIVPDDLKEIIIEGKFNKKYVKIPKKEIDIELFTKQVKRLEVKNDSIIVNPLDSEQESKIDPPKSVLGKLVDYFKEFSDNSNYTELRMLGLFDEEELSAIHLFNEICLRRDTVVTCPEKDGLLEVLNNELLEFIMKEEEDGQLVIYKHDRTE